MHDPRTPFRRPVLALLAALVVAVPACGASAAPSLLHEGVVAGDATDAGRPAAATAALRQVVVRVTGRRDAAADPALEDLYAAAVGYARTFRAAPAGHVAVAFDAARLDATLARRGLPPWPRDRPAALVLLALERPGQVAALAVGTEDEARAIERAAWLRGLSLAWPDALDAGAARAALGAVRAGNDATLLALARRHDAGAVLHGRATPAGAAWRWVLPDAGGRGDGAVEEGVHALADALARSATAGRGAGGRLPLVVRTPGGDGYARALAALASEPALRDVRLDRAAGEELTFGADYAGDPAALRRALAAGGRLVPEGDGGALRFALAP